MRNFETTKTEIESEYMIKETFISHAGFAFLAFDKKGYVVFGCTRNSAGMSGYMTWDKAIIQFLTEVTSIIHGD